MAQSIRCACFVLFKFASLFLCNFHLSSYFYLPSSRQLPPTILLYTALPRTTTKYYVPYLSCNPARPPCGPMPLRYHAMLFSTTLSIPFFTHRPQSHHFPRGHGLAQILVPLSNLAIYMDHPRERDKRIEMDTNEIGRSIRLV